MFRRRNATRFMACFCMTGALLGTLMLSGQTKRAAPKGADAPAARKKRAITDLRIQGHGSVSMGDTVLIDANPIIAEADTDLHGHLGVAASMVWFQNYRSGTPVIPKLPPCSLTPITVPSSSSGETRTWTSGNLTAKIESNPSANNNTLVVWAYYEDNAGAETEYCYERKYVKYKGKQMKFFTAIKLGDVPLTKDVVLKEEKYLSLTVGTEKRSGRHPFRVHARFLPNQHSPRRYHDMGTMPALLLRADAKEKGKQENDDVKIWKRDRILLRVGSESTAPGATVVAAKAPGLSHNTLVLWATYRIRGVDIVEQTAIHFDATTKTAKGALRQPLAPREHAVFAELSSARSSRRD